MRGSISTSRNVLQPASAADHLRPSKLDRVAAVFLLAIGLLSSGVSSTSFGKSPASRTSTKIETRLSSKDRLEVFEEVWQTVRDRYYDPSFNGVDWHAVRTRYRPLVER